jgi:hypothetical protein
MVIISGATKPGVPHLTYKYLVACVLVAKPKSTILAYPFKSTIIFSGFISLCAIFFAYI